MSRRIRTAARADSDIRSIAHWIAQENTRAAVKWADDLYREFLKISDTPGIGTDRNDLRPGLRSIAFGSYLIFFKSMRSGIVIVRVLHGARDYARIFAK